MMRGQKVVRGDGTVWTIGDVLTGYKKHKYGGMAAVPVTEFLLVRETEWDYVKQWGLEAAEKIGYPPSETLVLAEQEVSS